MAKYGILVDAQWCSGCHSCEVACQMEHGLPVGQTGIKVVKIGPWVIGDEADENWQFSYLPIPTKQCDTCAARRERQDGRKAEDAVRGGVRKVTQPIPFD